MRVWNIRDTFGQAGQIRLRRDGRLEKKLCGQRLWRLIRMVDISIFTEKDVQEALKNTEGIAQVKSQRG